MIAERQLRKSIFILVLLYLLVSSKPYMQNPIVHRLLSQTHLKGLRILPTYQWASSCVFSSSPSNRRGSEINNEYEIPIADDVASDRRNSVSNYDTMYRLDGIGRRSKVEITTNTGHQLSTDIPKKMGGTDTAPQPVEMLLGAWMGCTQATALFVGRQMSPRIVVESLSFERIEAVRDERGALALPIEEIPPVPSRLRRITGQIRVVTQSKTSLTSEQMEILKEQTEIRCPVANMILASGCAIDVEWIDSTIVQ